MFPGEANPFRFTVMKHLTALKDGDVAVVIMFDSSDLVNGVRKMAYTMFELREQPGAGKTELLEDNTIPDEMLEAPNWFLYYQLENLPGMARIAEPAVLRSGAWHYPQ